MSKKIIFIIVVIFLITTCGYSQSRLHYTDTADGAMPVALFPQKNDRTFIYKSFVLDSTVNYIDDIEQLLLNIDSTKGYKVEDIKRGAKSISCKIEIEFGNQPWEITVFGSPVIAFNRNASKVKFQGMYGEKNGEGYFRLDNFETNRNTLRGAAKNDGDPNIIQWQRVNSLLMERSAECGNLSNRKDVEKMYNYNSQIATECCLYCMEWNLTNAIINAIEKVISGESVEFENTLLNPIYFYFDKNEFADSHMYDNIKERFVKKGDYSILNLKTDAFVAPPVVYVSSGDHDYEKAGKEALEAQIIIDKLATVSSNKENADVLIDYIVDTEGRDKSIVTIYNKRGEILASGKKGSSESSSENREVAKSLYKSVVAKGIHKWRGE